MNLFNRILSFLPLIMGAVQHVQATVTASGADKKTKALDMVLTGLTTMNAIDPTVLAHPAFQDALGKVNDAVVFAGKVGQAIADNVTVPAAPASIGG